MSTIKVDTYQTRGGASEIAIDKLKGVTTTDVINVQTGSVTTVLQLGIASHGFPIPCLRCSSTF